MDCRVVCTRLKVISRETKRKKKGRKKTSNTCEKRKAHARSFPLRKTGSSAAKHESRTQIKEENITMSDLENKGFYCKTGKNSII